MENLDKNIVAISTPIGNGGISIIRMSGKSVAEIADKVFFAHTKVSEFEPRKLYLGTFKYEDICDKCMCVYFKAPFSYTGEDLIEFQCHGGMTLTNKIFEFSLHKFFSIRLFILSKNCAEVIGSTSCSL